MHRLAFALSLLVATSSTGLAVPGVVNATVQDSAGQPVPDAIVSLTPLDTPAPAFTEPAKPVEIAQIGEQYRPYVTAVRVGTRVDFPNKDEVQHHLYSLSKAKRFEKPLYEGGASENVLFDQPGVITLGCNIHDWMVAYVLVLETPYFAKTAIEGTASVSNLPAGRYLLDVWHPRLAKTVSREVTLADDTTLTEAAVLKLKPDRRVRRAPSGTGKAY